MAFANTLFSVMPGLPSNTCVREVRHILISKGVRVKTVRGNVIVAESPQLSCKLDWQAYIWLWTPVEVQWLVSKVEAQNLNEIDGKLLNPWMGMCGNGEYNGGLPVCLYGLDTLHARAASVDEWLTGLRRSRSEHDAVLGAWLRFVCGIPEQLEYSAGTVAMLRNIPNAAEPIGKDLHTENLRQERLKDILNRSTASMQVSQTPRSELHSVVLEETPCDQASP